MSLTTVVTVHCDVCGQWEHTDASGSVAATARDRKRRGWVTDRDEYGRRRDRCPRCVQLQSTANHPAREDAT